MFSANAGLNDQQWVKFLKRWLILSLILHMITGVLSVGFYDMDEHFQVMEFLSYKLGRTPVSHLAPEYAGLLRSWAQPTLYELLTRIWLGLGISSPSFWACAIRLFSSFLGWLSLVGISLCSYSWFNTDRFRRLSVKFAALLYFFPYLHARTSSENLSGSFFFIALSLLFLIGKRNSKFEISYVFSFSLGILLGLSFLFRFQVGFMILGLGAWCLFIARIRFSRLIGIFLGIITSILFGILLDWRGFGAWTFTPFNYFSFDLIEGKATAAGAFPWWYYFRYLNGDVPLIGNLLATGALVGCVLSLTNPVTLSVVPFFLIHVIISHKEPRYLFPLISGLPVLITYTCELGDRILNSVKAQWKRFFAFSLFRWARNAVLVLNFGGLIVAGLKPAAVQPLLHSYLFEHQQYIPKLFYLGRDPFELIGLQMDFYRPQNLQVISAGDFEAFFTDLKNSRDPLWLYYIHYELPSEAGRLVSQCQLQYSVFPSWMKIFSFLPGIKNSANKGSLFKCFPPSGL